MPYRPLVSIVTPTLNQVQFLEKTLRAVWDQSYANFEHIVVDGGSTDGTLDILRREGDAGRIRWISEPDTGMYDAVNKGIALARGDILAYLNSDDAYMPWTIESVVRVFGRRPRVDLVYGDGLKVEEHTGRQRLRLFPPFDRVSLSNYESLMQPAVFWRRELTERIGGFDTSLRYVADLDYWLRASAAGAQIAHINEVLALERIHAERLSASQADAMAAEDHAMRIRHGGGAVKGEQPRWDATIRDMRWQRWLWIRFVVAASLRPLPGPWHRFLRQGGVVVRRRKALSASRPYNYKGLWHAMVSRLAAEILGVGLPTRRVPARPDAVPEYVGAEATEQARAGLPTADA